VKVLVSCVNSLVSLVGYDTERREPFWYCPGNLLRACGAAWDGGDLLLASDDFLTRIAPDQVTQSRLPAPHPNLAHSVHMLEDGLVGVADTGNSRLLVRDPAGKGAAAFEPLSGWPEVPSDAIHLNDFCQTPAGLFASCFSFRPLPKDYGRFDWRGQGHGLILALDKQGGHDASRIVGCGISCPHTLAWHEERLYCCASASGTWLRFAVAEDGVLAREAVVKVTDTHFLRGALRVEGGWLLGGSSRRHLAGEASCMALYLLSDAGEIAMHRLANRGEVYDVLPWTPAMDALVPVINSLAPQEWDDGNVYPPVCAFP